MNDLKTLNRRAPARPDPEQAERTDAFRGALQNTSSKALGVALATGAFALTARPAFGQSMPSVTKVLNFALKLEYLEREFYNKGVAEDGLIPSGGEYDAMGKYTEIRDNERAHVQVLQDALGDDAIDKPEFDFTGGNGSGDGPFDPFNSYTQFLILSQGFEDTGVRAYKGQAPNLLDHDDVLTTALQIHSVEARHAAIVRRLVSKEDISTDQEAWIERNGRNRPMPGGFGDPLQAVYAGMDETVKYQIDVADEVNDDMDDSNDVSDVTVTEAFDEALDMQAVLDIADPFIVGDQSGS